MLRYFSDLARFGRYKDVKQVLPHLQELDWSFISNYIVLLELYFLTLKLEAFGSLICACYHLLDGAKMCYSVRSIFSTRLDKISL